MNKILVQKRIGKSVILTCLLLSLQASFVLAAEDITGEWEIRIDYNGFMESFATLYFSRKADGTLMGKWGSRELADVRFEDGKLTFARRRMSRHGESIEEYSGTLKEGKFTGTLSTDYGDFLANMTRKKPKSPVLGQWYVKFDVGEREITDRLIISEKPDGTLAGKWKAERGEHVISNVKFQDGKLTYTLKSKFDEYEWESTFEGTIEGHKLVGAFMSQRGEIQATGERIGASLVGKWEMITTSGGDTCIMKIYGDLTGMYEYPKGDELPIENLKLEGDQVTFSIDPGWVKQKYSMDYFIPYFEGKLDGKTLRGKLCVEGITVWVTYKKLDVAIQLIGTWEFTRETSRGTRMSTLKIKENMTGTYTYRDNETAVTDLKVDGDQVSFKVTMRWQDREYPMEFKGKLDGTSLKGEFTTSRGTREATGKKID